MKAPTQNLLYLKDPSFPLLKKLRTKAPGTYFHSLIVAELASGASFLFPKKANPLLAQLGGMYHDIGKISNPQVYAENQEDANYPFQPEIIITHIQKSLEIAEAFHLPIEIKKFMATHHGSHPPPQDKKNTAQIYPGAFLPQSIEETLVMLADSCEAAVRSVQTYNKTNISEMIHKIFQNKIKNDQLRNSVLLPNDLYQIEDVFLEIFLSLYHRRYATEN